MTRDGKSVFFVLTLIRRLAVKQTISACKPNSPIIQDGSIHKLNPDTNNNTNPKIRNIEEPGVYLIEVTETFNSVKKKNKRLLFAEVKLRKTWLVQESRKEI